MRSCKESRHGKEKKKNQKIHLLACEGLANAIETSNYTKIDELLHKYLDEYENKKIDSVVLGCTHYPIISDKIRVFFPDAKIIDGNLGVAKRVKYVLEENNMILGFLDFWITFDSATIAQIAIRKTYQGRHLANLLMQEMIDDCFAKKVANIALEVRVSNLKAISLYTKYGFKKIVIKPHYYDKSID